MNFDIDNHWLLPLFSYARSRKQEFNDLMQLPKEDMAEYVGLVAESEISLDDRMGLSRWILRQAIDECGIDNICLAWTGGKDSTLILWQMRELVKELDLPLPQIMFINEGQVFEEVMAFVNLLTDTWKLDVDEVHNSDVSDLAKSIGDKIAVADLSKRNQDEIARMGYTNKTFNYDPESLVGNHLMKTVAMNMYLEKHDFETVITGIRWDEQEARSEETYFSKRGDDHTPEHTRVHPILHLDERAIWEATFANKIPYCSLYEQGYRSLGAKGTTKKSGDLPAWEQDFGETSERSGRQQDKEEVMQRLRDLGYM